MPDIVALILQDDIVVLVFFRCHSALNNLRNIGCLAHQEIRKVSLLYKKGYLIGYIALKIIVHLLVFANLHQLVPNKAVVD
jgi:hypothetical protein